jgi:hypothetical protein
LDGFKQRWDGNMHLAADSHIPVRLVVRQAIDLMDSVRYSR